MNVLMTTEGNGMARNTDEQHTRRNPSTERRSGVDRRGRDKRFRTVGMAVGIVGVLLATFHNPGWLLLALAGLAIYDADRPT